MSSKKEILKAAAKKIAAREDKARTAAKAAPAPTPQMTPEEVARSLEEARWERFRTEERPVEGLFGESERETLPAAIREPMTRAEVEERQRLQQAGLRPGARTIEPQDQLNQTLADMANAGVFEENFDL